MSTLAAPRNKVYVMPAMGLMTLIAPFVAQPGCVPVIDGVAGAVGGALMVNGPVAVEVPQLFEAVTVYVPTGWLGKSPVALEPTITLLLLRRL